MSTTSASATADATTTTIWAALDMWSLKLSVWQRTILKLAVVQGRLSESDIKAVYEVFLQEKSLRAAPGERAATPTTVTSRPLTSTNDRITLDRVTGLQGINALSASAELTFGKQLTIVYGANGAGKSGFVRLLANICFSRHRPAILSDINAEAPRPAPKASIHLSIGDAAQPPVSFEVGASYEQLRRISVFDTAVARQLLSQAAAFEFKPAGFDVFPEFVRVYAALSDLLEADIAAKTSPNRFPDAFLGGGSPTIVHELVSGLGPETDMAKLRLLAIYGDAERARFTEVEKQLLALASKSPKDALVSLHEARDDITRLVAQLGRLQALFGRKAQLERVAKCGAAAAAQERAKALGAEQFQRTYLLGIGGPEWEAFVSHAHVFGQVQRDGYPASSDRCLLCEQELGEAANHVADLFQFAVGEARAAAKSATDVLVVIAQSVAAADVEVFANESRVRGHVLRLAPPLAGQLDLAARGLSACKAATLQDLRTMGATAMPVDVNNEIEALQDLLLRLSEDIVRLEADDTEASIRDLSEERRLLRHRNVLSQQLQSIETYVADATWAAKATAVRTSFGTRAVTDKEKELFTQIIGEDYRLRFESECCKLGCSIPVQMQTVGRAGQTLRSLEMKGGHKPEHILSEGEQRAVALADFLTEVSMNPIAAGIVFDDPVNSLDHERRGSIAARLVEEAAERQVIVFTHDLVFLTQLLDAVEASDAAVEVEHHWVERSSNNTPGQVSLNDVPPTMKRYDSTARAREHLSVAQSAAGSAREAAVRAGIGALRTTIEEAIVKRLLKGAVPRWSDRVIVGALSSINWDQEKVDSLIALFEQLSAYLEGHSHTDEAAGAPPSTKILEDYITKVDELIKWAKKSRIN